MANENTSKRGRGRPRKEAKASLSKMTQIHGRDEEGKKYKAVTMAQIWGDGGTGGKYKTLDEGEYKDYLSGLNRADLYKHATKIGLVPIDNTNLLKRRLIAEHKRHPSQYKHPLDDANQLSPEELAKMEERVKQILG